MGTPQTEVLAEAAEVLQRNRGKVGWREAVTAVCKYSLFPLGIVPRVNFTLVLLYEI